MDRVFRNAKEGLRSLDRKLYLFAVLFSFVLIAIVVVQKQDDPPLREYGSPYRAPRVTTSPRSPQQAAVERDLVISEVDGYWGQSGVIALSSSEEPRIKVSGYVVSENVVLSVYKATQDDLLRFLTYEQEEYEINQVNPEVDVGDLEFVATLDKEPDEIESDSRNTYQTSASFGLPLDGAGIWYVTAKSGDKSTGSFVVLSDLGVVTKQSLDDYIFWGQKHSSKRSITNGNIKLYKLSDTVQEVGSADFTSEGLATIPFVPSVDIAIAQSGSDMALIPVNLTRLNSYGRGWRSNDFSTLDPTTRYFTFTDRPIYEPGDTIYFKSIIRDERDMRYTLPSGTARAMLYADYDEPVIEKTIAIDSSGSVSGEFEIPDDLKTGTYSIFIDIGNVERETNTWGYYNYYSNSAHIQVEHFKKPEYSIDIFTPSREYVAGDEIPVTVDGTYFFGQPVVGGTLSYKIVKSDYYNYNYFSAKQNISDDYRYGFRYGDTLDSGDTTFDSSGQAAFSIPTSKDARNKVYTIEAEYVDESGIPVFARRNVVVYRGGYEITRNDRIYRRKVGEESDVVLKLISHNGENVSGIELTNSIKGTKWVRVQSSDTYRYEKEDVSFSIPEKITTDQNGEARFTIRPREGGSYSLSVKGEDSAGNTIENSFYLWVTDKDTAYFDESGDSDIVVTVLKEEHAFDEDVQLQLTSKEADRDVLLTFERARVNRYQIVRMNGYSEELNIPLVETDIPNIYVTASTFSTSRLSTSTKNIILSTDPKEMSIEITPDRDIYGPGDTVTLNVLTTDYKGNPLSTNTAIWAVDKAIFELANENKLEILKSFWSEKYNQTPTAHSLEGIHINSAEGGGCFAPETGVLMSDGNKKEIQDIQVGDKVLTRRSEKDARLEEAVVEAVYKHEVAGYYIINGYLKVTPEHRLYINGVWREVSTLSYGDVLTKNDGSLEYVTSIEWQKKKSTVYNLHIKDYETYFADGVWVHNQKGDLSPREIFKDTAYWNPNVQTDENGRAQIVFSVPDNLTTWTIASVGANRDTVVGAKTEEILVSKGVVVRPLAPNLLRTGDKFIFSALVQNYSGSVADFDVSLTSDDFKILSNNYTKEVIPHREIKEYTWDIEIENENEDATFELSAIPESDVVEADIVRNSIPVTEFGFTESKAFTASGNTEFDVSFSNDTNYEKSDATLFLAPTLLTSLTPAMEYLVTYPYGCIEQTTSRFVPAVIAASNRDIFGSYIAEKDIDDIVDTGLSRLTNLQNSDGGWSWWHHRRSDPFITAYVLEYVLAAKELGYEVDEGMLFSAEKFMESDYLRKVDKLEPRDLQIINASRKYGLSLLGSEKAKEIEVDYSLLSPDVLSLAIIANVRLGNTNPAENGINMLLNEAKNDGNLTFWEGGYKSNFGSRNTSTALAIRALTFADTNADITTEAIAYLLRKRESSYWSNSYATAQVLQAAVDYNEVTGELDPDFSYTVKFNDEIVKTGRVTDAKRVIDPIEIDSTYFDTGDAPLNVVIEKDGDKGEIYSTIVMNDFHKDPNYPQIDNGLLLERAYLDKDGSEYEQIGIGDVVTVELSVSGIGDASEYIVIHDELPAGLSPINERLNNEQYQNSRSSNYSNYYYYGEDGKEYTENGVTITLRRVRGNSYKATYKARAVARGEFGAPPAVVNIMYQPEERGNTEATRIKIDTESITKERERTNRRTGSETGVSESGVNVYRLPVAISIGVILATIMFKMYISGYEKSKREKDAYEDIDD